MIFTYNVLLILILYNVYIMFVYLWYVFYFIIIKFSTIFINFFTDSIHVCWLFSSIGKYVITYEPSSILLKFVDEMMT